MIKLLLAEEDDPLDPIFEQLEEYQAKRKADWQDQRAHLDACVAEQVDPQSDPAFLVETDEFVGGLPTSRVAEHWGKPVVTYRRTGDGFRGGGRTDPDVNFLDLYAACADLLEEYWGHPGAAGFRISETAIPEFKQRFLEALQSKYDVEDLRPRIDIDGRLTPDHLGTELLDELEQLQPFGNGHDAPAFLLEGVELADVTTFGEDDEHCKFVPSADTGHSVIFWNGTDAIDELEFPVVCDLVGALEWDDFAECPGFVLKDFRVSAST